MAQTAQDEGLSPDLIPFISEPNVSMAVVAVTGARWARQMSGDLEVYGGPMTFQVISAIHGTLRDGQSIEVPARRVVDRSARVRHNFDAWNTLLLSSGDYLILAVRPGASPRTWKGVAGRAVPGPDASDVQTVRRAYEIEEAGGDLAAKAGMLEGCLRSGQELLLFYALDYLRRHASDRGAAAQILAGALASSLPASEQKLEMGRALAGAEFFQRPAKADPVNRMVVASLASALVQEIDGSRRASWSQLVVSCVLMDFTGDEAENEKIRVALIYAPGSPAPDRVVSAISSAQHFATSDAQPYLLRLKRVWQSQ